MIIKGVEIRVLDKDGKLWDLINKNDDWDECLVSDLKDPTVTRKFKLSEVKIKFIRGNYHNPRQIKENVLIEFKHSGLEKNKANIKDFVDNFYFKNPTVRNFFPDKDDIVDFIEES